jgi:hypothetical protein
MGSHPAFNQTISSHVASCAKAFDDVYNGIRNTDRDLELDFTSVRDEYGRLKIWSGNIAGHHTGRRSLEYRLRDALHIREQVVEILVELKEILDSSE